MVRHQAGDRAGLRVACRWLLCKCGPAQEDADSNMQAHSVSHSISHYEFGNRFFQNRSIAARSEPRSIRQLLSNTMAVNAFGVTGLQPGKALVFGLPVCSNGSPARASFGHST